MQWLNKIVDELTRQHPDGELVVSSGVSPSGKYHLGTLREVLTAEAVAHELRRRGRQARHIHVVDDLDVFRKVPAGIPESYSQYLGKPLCDIPSPDDPKASYADYYLQDLVGAAERMHIDAEFMRSNLKYREGFFVEAIEKALDDVAKIRDIIERISGRHLDDSWSPIQVIEDGYLKSRQFVNLDKASKTLTYKDKDDRESQVDYSHGDVKLNWRIDWPARWWLLNVDCEPFGRDHATKGGSYDTGAEIVKDVYGAEAPYPVPYHFINRSGETKKMSKSAGDTITIAQLLEVLPPEVVWFFVVRYAPDKQLFFDEGEGLIRLVDEFGELLAKSDKTDADKQLIELCMHGIDKPTVSRIPFSHLVASYQAALKDIDKTLAIISLTDYKTVVDEEPETVKAELRFIDAWLTNYAPDEVKFELQQQISTDDFSDVEKKFFADLADKVEAAPIEADGAWFHNAVYELKDSSGLAPKELFAALYRLLINKSSGPRAGWFLSMLPRDWLIKRLRLAA